MGNLEGSSFIETLHSVEGGDFGTDVECFIGSPVETKQEKIEGAKYLEKAVQNVFNFDPKLAKEFGDHELKHALADPGGGFYLLARQPLDNKCYATYVHIGERSIIERLRIAIAPGLDMSSGDRENVLSLIKEAMIIGVLTKILEKKFGKEDQFD